MINESAEDKKIRQVANAKIVARALLQEAEKISDGDFIRSCRNFFEERGYLSPAQMDALANTRPFKRKQGSTPSWGIKGGYQ